MNYQIKQLKLENFYKCSNIWNMNKQNELAEKFYNEMITGNRITFIYINENDYIGEVSLVFDKNDTDYTIKDKRIYLSRLLVKKEYRGQKIGTKLLHYAITYAKNLGYQEISIGVNIDNYIALKLYIQTGFKEIIFVGEDQDGKYLKLLKKLN